MHLRRVQNCTRTHLLVNSMSWLKRYGYSLTTGKRAQPMKKPPAPPKPRHAIKWWRCDCNSVNRPGQNQCYDCRGNIQQTWKCWY